MALLGKTEILNADDIPFKDVKVPEWGGEVRVRGLSGAERDRYEQSCLRLNKGKPEANVRDATARLAAWCMIDENNSRLFVNEDEVKELGRKSASALQRVFDAAAELSGLRAGDVEAMVGDFD